MRSVVLFSGGLDSTTVLAYALSKNEDIFPLSFSYGQKHMIEIEKSKAILEKYGLSKKSKTITLDLSFLDDCSLINKDIDIPKTLTDSIPSTYVPSRNIIFLSIAASYAESLGASKIYMGVNAVDYSGYPDCRPEFIKSFQHTLKIGTKFGIETGISIEAPIINMKKSEIIKLGISLDVDYSQTHSCYSPVDAGKACGICDSCKLRKKGFKDAEIADPTIYGGLK